MSDRTIPELGESYQHRQTGEVREVRALAKYFVVCDAEQVFKRDDFEKNFIVLEAACEPIIKASF